MLDTLTLKLHLQGVRLSLLHMQLPKSLTKQTIEQVMRSPQYMIWKEKRSFDYHTAFYIHFFFFLMESILLQKYKHSFIESQGSVISKGLVTVCFPSDHTIEPPFIVELPGESLVSLAYILTRKLSFWPTLLKASSSAPQCSLYWTHDGNPIPLCSTIGPVL